MVAAFNGLAVALSSRAAPIAREKTVMMLFPQLFADKFVRDQRS